MKADTEAETSNVVYDGTVVCVKRDNFGKIVQLGWPIKLTIGQE